MCQPDTGGPPPKVLAYMCLGWAVSGAGGHSSALGGQLSEGLLVQDESAEWWCCGASWWFTRVSMVELAAQVCGQYIAFFKVMALMGRDYPKPN